jgi:hypothetical protein
MDLVVKKVIFPPQKVDENGFRRQKKAFPAENADENGSRRQKGEFFASKRRRERVSSLKNGVSRTKMPTRMDLVAKKRSFSAQNADEKGSRRQKVEFPAPKW